MKHYIYSLLIFLWLQTSAQQPDSFYVAKEKQIQQLFSKVPKNKFADLVPFEENGKWGYVDRTSLKRLVEPVFHGPAFFHPAIRIYFMGEMVNISSSGEVKIERPLPDEARMSYMDQAAPAGQGYDAKVRPSSDGFKGFTVSSTGELLTYSDLYWYNKQGIPGWNIQLFKYKGAYYGIVKNLRGAAGIIDQQGNPLHGFDFNYHEILENRDTRDTSSFWVFVKKKPGDYYSLINMEGKIILPNEIISYPLLSNELAGYTPYIQNDTSALFDRHEMKWIVKPQTRVRIEAVDFSSRTQLSNEIRQLRREAFIYYKVREGDRSYWVDMKGRKYLVGGKK